MSTTKDDVSIKRQLAASSFRYLLGKHWAPTEKYSILMYHRIISPEEVPYPIQAGMYVRPETFKIHLEYLNKEARVIPLMDLIKEIESGETKSKKKTLAITFDDGWSDFNTYAYPLLKKYATPASVFLPTAYIGSSKLFWTDLLAFHLKTLSNSQNKTAITLRIKESSIDATYKELFTNYLQETQNNFSNNLETLIEKLKLAHEEDRRNVLNQISNLAKEYSTTSYPDPQFMNWEQVRKIQEEGLVTFGCHSHNHALLSQLRSEQIKDDLSQCIQTFKENSVSYIPIFCYPNQSRTQETDSLLKEAGFQYSLGRTEKNENLTNVSPPVLNRIGIHEDVSSDSSLFSFRIWTNK